MVEVIVKENGISEPLFLYQSGKTYGTSTSVWHKLSMEAWRLDACSTHRARDGVRVQLLLRRSGHR